MRSVTRKVSDLYSFIPATHRRNSMTDWDLGLFSPKQHLLGRSKGNRSQKTCQKTCTSRYSVPVLIIILHFTFLVFVFLQIDKINIYDRQTTMRNEIHLSKVLVTWVFVAKARARETIAHKLVNTRVECSPFVQFISWEMTQATTLLLICFSSRNSQLTFGQYCNTIQSSKL